MLELDLTIMKQSTRRAAEDAGSDMNSAPRVKQLSNGENLQNDHSESSGVLILDSPPGAGISMA